MNLHLQKMLVCCYPYTFRKRESCRSNGEPGVSFGSDTRNSPRPLNDWGIQCGDGWFALVDRISAAFEREIKSFVSKGKLETEWPRPAQIKEKLGRLAFCVSGHVSYELRAFIQQIEDESFCICEQCGRSIVSPAPPRSACLSCPSKLTSR